jgi:hypothetical protein
MSMSPYFHALRAEYEAELDDLRTDSEGRRVLDRRLADKRGAFAQMLPLMTDAPVMLAPVFHRAFAFEAVPRPLLRRLLDAEPGDFPSWGELSAAMPMADWARPLAEQALAEEGGEDFLSTVIGLEYMEYLGNAGVAPAGTAAAEEADGERRPRRDGDHDDGDGDDGEDADALTDDFLEQQGFDRRGEQ